MSVWYWPLYDEIYLLTVIYSHEQGSEERVLLKWKTLSVNGLVYIGEFE